MHMVGLPYGMHAQATCTCTHTILACLQVQAPGMLWMRFLWIHACSQKSVPQKQCLCSRRAPDDGRIKHEPAGEAVGLGQGEEALQLLHCFRLVPQQSCRIEGDKTSSLMTQYSNC